MAQQSALVLIATFPAAVLVTLQPSESNQIWFWSGLSLLVAGVVLVATARDGELERWRELIVPTLDIVAIGMLRIATWPDGTQLASLVLAPALWLVMRFRVRGVAIAFAMITVATSVPAIALTGDVALATATRFLLLPFTFLLIATMALTLYANLSKSHFSLQRTHQRLSKVTKDSEQQRRLFSAVYSNLNVGVLVMDADGNDIMANDAQERLHRLVSPPGNVDRTEAGHLIFDASGKQIPAEYRPARRVIRGETFDGVLIHVGPPGPHQLVYSVTSRLVQTGDGDVEARILVFDDVTERFRSGQAREQVIATVSHELRTPLTSILGYTDLAMDELSAASEGDLDGVKDYLDVVQRNAEALLARVEDLLLHQQATSGRLSLDIRPADVVELVGRSIESLRGLAEERSVEVRFTRQEPLEMKVDARRLSQVIDNLLSNALKYTEPGGNVTLSVEENQDGVHLSVADTGTGMTTTEVEELFTPFYRTQAALHSAVGGAGLGLLVSRGIAEAHGGTLTVWSEFGTGSTFHLRLPKHGPETLDDHSGTSTDDDR
ncbi:MAG: sensor histidine kinase [Micrococcaceae bacterium]